MMRVQSKEKAAPFAQKRNHVGGLQNMEEKRVYRVYEIQEILGIGQNTAYTLVRRKEFRSVQIGDHIRISKKSFDRWLEQMTT